SRSHSASSARLAAMWVGSRRSRHSASNSGPPRNHFSAPAWRQNSTTSAGATIPVMACSRWWIRRNRSSRPTRQSKSAASCHWLGWPRTGARLRWGIRHPAGELDWGKRHMIRPTCAALAVAVGLALGSGPAMAADTSPFAHDPYPSTYERIAAPPVLITGATVLDGAGNRIDGADVLMADGVIVEVGRGLQAPAGATRVDGTGKWVTPGIIDVHSHLGVYPSPGVRAHSDGNEAVAPNTAH